jgi:hypothetical protein
MWGRRMYGYNLKCELYDTALKKVTRKFRARENAVLEKNANFVNYMASGGQRYAIETFDNLDNIKEMPYQYNVLINGNSFKITVVNEQIYGFGKKSYVLVLE